MAGYDLNIAKKIQQSLNTMGFDTGGIDGLFGVKSSASLILLQCYLNRADPGQTISGEVDLQTLEQVKAATANGTTCSKVNLNLRSWTPKVPSVDTWDESRNGCLSEASMVRIPTGNYEKALMEKHAAIAWAMLIGGVIGYNRTVNPKDQLSVNKFSCTGINSAYRAYHYQVEAYICYRHGGSLASCPTFAKGSSCPVQSNKKNANNVYAEKWISENWAGYKSDGVWNDIPDKATASGGDLEGYGHSNHGWGLAIDFAVNDPGTAGGGKGYSTTKEVKWLEKHAREYGFYGLYDSTKAKGYFKETWHWAYAAVQF